MKMKRIAAGIAAGLVAASLFAGCGGGGGGGASSGGDAKPAASAPKLPARAPVSTPPVATFPFGKIEAKVYEIASDKIDATVNVNMQSLAATKDGVYFHGKKKQGDDKETYLWKFSYQGEKGTGLAPVAPCKLVMNLASNGQWVFYRGSQTKTLDWYDGTTAHTGKAWGDQTFAVEEGGGTFYYIEKKSIMKGQFSSGEIKDAKAYIENYEEAPIGAKGFRVDPIYADKDEFFVRTFFKPEGQKTSDNCQRLIALDATGKEKYRIDDNGKSSSRRWVVTTNYILFTDRGKSKDDHVFRLYDRRDGKVIGEIKTTYSPYHVCHVQGNDVIFYDAGKSKFYRIDL